MLDKCMKKVTHRPIQSQGPRSHGMSERWRDNIRSADEQESHIPSVCDRSCHSALHLQHNTFALCEGVGGGVSPKWGTPDKGAAWAGPLNQP